jgi:hypothetical protein
VGETAVIVPVGAGVSAVPAGIGAVGTSTIGWTPSPSLSPGDLVMPRRATDPFAWASDRRVF